MERRQASGVAFSVRESVAIVVPLCTELADCHSKGARFFVHPSSIVLNATGFPRVAPDLGRELPASPRDHACLAPEERHGLPGDARSSVFTIGAILYELLTTESVGPGMVRPTQLIPALSPAVEIILGKALVTDRAHRPADLGALAQALHHLAPASTIPPPEADESHLDQGADYPVDVSLSMLPPEPTPAATKEPTPASSPVGPAPRSAGARHVPAADPFGMAIRDAPKPALRPDDPTLKLADLKTRLEADPRPRYVVIKDGMDHGPFNAVELLQQIGSHAFESDHILRDTFSNDDKSIGEWSEFAPFADHAKLHREIVAEKKANQQVAVAEAKGTRAKTFFGLAAIGLILAALLGWYVTERVARTEALAIAADEGVNVESSGGIKGRSRKTANRSGAGAGNFPALPGGMSCEQARAKYVEEINIGGPRGGQADLTAGQFGAVLNNGSYISGCGTPSSMHVSVCAAVQNGRAVGVTVSTEPPNAGITNCITSAIRRMNFPSNPKLDIATTRF